jgi:hypothetical protein
MLGGKAGWSPAARQFVQTGQPMDTEASAPLANDLARHVEAGSDTVVAKTLARQEYDFSPHNITIR